MCVCVSYAKFVLLSCQLMTYARGASVFVSMDTASLSRDSMPTRALFCVCYISSRELILFFLIYVCVCLSVDRARLPPTRPAVELTLDSPSLCVCCICVSDQQTPHYHTTQRAAQKFWKPHLTSRTRMLYCAQFCPLWALGACCLTQHSAYV